MNSLEKLLEVTRDFNTELKNVETEERERRQRIVEQNGNSALHYEQEVEDRKSIPVFSGCVAYFPDALKEVSKCSLAGQKQHNHGDKLYWDKNKSNDNSDALIRHLIDHETNPMDDDGVLHLAKVAWRALAVLQIYLDGKE